MHSLLTETAVWITCEQMERPNKIKPEVRLRIELFPVKFAREFACE